MGSRPDDRREKRDLVVTLALHADLARAGQSDDLADSIDYSHLKKQIVAALDATPIETLERAAELVASLALADRRACAVDVSVGFAPDMACARFREVTISRRQQG